MNLTPVFANGTEVETDTARVFFSYRTPVAAYIFGRGFVKTEQFFSVTTSRHINKWLKDGHSDFPEFETISQKEIEALA
jgi:hypothetical protein|tara:strand:- start:10 stop:246 length:237 start_codon:yes stop_codon:yes gene_type:complete